MKSMLSRRTFLASAALAAAALAGCSSAADEPEGSQAGSSAGAAGSAPANTSDTAGQEATDAQTGSVLVVYFSATGNTEGIAQAIAERLGANAFPLVPSEPYTEEDLDYNDSMSRTSQERTPDARPALITVTPEAFDAYDTVLVGYPIWWGEAAWPLRTFVEGNDFTGKTVVPFCTSASSGIGSSADGLVQLAGTGDWREGFRFAAGATEDAAAWAEGLGL